jgi:hypothetical protein
MQCGSCREMSKIKKFHGGGMEPLIEAATDRNYKDVSPKEPC